jgi:hypothetical protein
MKFFLLSSYTLSKSYEKLHKIFKRRGNQLEPIRSINGRAFPDVRHNVSEVPPCEVELATIMRAKI